MRAAYIALAVQNAHRRRYRGALAGVRPDDLMAHLLRALAAQQPELAARLDHVVIGATNQAGEDNRNVARMAALLAGLPFEVPAVTAEPPPAEDRGSRPCATRFAACGRATPTW